MFYSYLRLIILIVAVIERIFTIIQMNICVKNKQTAKNHLDPQFFNLLQIHAIKLNYKQQQS